MIRLMVGVFVLVVGFNWSAQAQNERKYIRKGNRIYDKALADTTKIDTIMYSEAETAYRKALDKRPDDPKWDFNLSDALYKQMKFDQSSIKFQEIAEKVGNKVDKSRAYHNMGNSLMMEKKLDESIEAYKKALRVNPDDLETKYNLLYAMNLKKKQQQQQKQDQNKDKDKEKKDQEKQDQKKDQDKQDKQDQQKKQQPQQNKISKENAERLLQALQNDEKKIQEKVKKVQAQKAQSRKTEKDW